MLSIFGIAPENFSIKGIEFIINISNADFEDSFIKLVFRKEETIPNQIITGTEKQLEIKICIVNGSETWIQAVIF